METNKTEEEAEAVTLAPLVVTGTRYVNEVSVGGKEPARLREIPQSVTVITKERIEDQGLRTVDEALNWIPGITLTPNNTLETQYRSRTHSLNATYDGVPAYGSLNAFPQLDLAIYEQIEVLRGPAGLFQGTGGIGGTINLVRKRAKREFGASASIAAGSWDNYNTTADVTGPLNTSGSLRGRLVVSGIDRKYFYDSTDTKKYLGYATLDWDITPATTLSLGFVSQESETRASSTGLPADSSTGKLLDLPRDTNLTTKWSRYEWTTKDYTAELAHHFDSGWRATAKILRREQNSKNHNGRQASSLNSVSKTLTYQSADTDGAYERDAVDFYVSGPFRLFGQEHKLLLGYNRDRYLLHTEYGYPNGGGYTNGTIGGIPFGRPDLVPDFSEVSYYLTGYETETIQSGFYGRLQLRLFDPLVVIAGARISDYRARRRSVAPSAPTAWVTSADKTNDEVTPYAGLVFDVNKQVSLYASYSDIFIPLTSQKADGSVLEPEIGEQYEVGGKGEFFNGKLNATLAWFQINDKNRAYLDPDSPGGGTWWYLNAGKLETKGWEIELAGSPAPGWNLQGSYTRQKTRYVKDSTASRVGGPLDAQDPEHMAKFWGAYSFGGEILNGLTLGLGATYQSKTAAGTTGTARLRTQGGYTVANALLAYRLNKNLLLSLNVNNLFDKKYYTRLGGTSVNTFYGEPRNFLLTLRASY
ncbi:MAG: TonB-dependent siderophore receptor [Zoogloeaceae bacterium]|jgi:outer membrane receptor for ferric coprogen and ferric-rhodotorulic acid|nr:TonB-dependent siderophore receptor [Zoogloeaceae bacterium]